VDLTDKSQAAFDAAAKLARGSGAKLFVVHVEEMLVMTTKFGFPDAVPEGDMRGLADALERAVPAEIDVPCDRRLLTDPVPQTILEFAEHERVDLIVMGSHGRRGVSRILMGSVAEAVVRGAKCPVLIVKPACATASCVGLGIR
jgi:nucleotide-binding universal stress UspA family protein